MKYLLIYKNRYTFINTLFVFIILFFLLICNSSMNDYGEKDNSISKIIKDERASKIVEKILLSTDAFKKFQDTNEGNHGKLRVVCEKNIRYKINDIYEVLDLFNKKSPEVYIFPFLSRAKGKDKSWFKVENKNSEIELIRTIEINSYYAKRYSFLKSLKYIDKSRKALYLAFSHIYRLNQKKSIFVFSVHLLVLNYDKYNHLICTSAYDRPDFIYTVLVEKKCNKYIVKVKITIPTYSANLFFKMPYPKDFEIPIEVNS